MSIVASVHNYRIWLIVWKKNAILKLVHEIGMYYTNDGREFNHIDNKLKFFMKFAAFFMIVTCIATGCIAVVFPVAHAINNTKRMFLNNKFPLDWSNSEIAFWLAFTFVAMGRFFSAVCCSLIPILWYLMLSLVFRYEISSEIWVTQEGEGRGETELK